VASQLVACLFV